VNENSAKLRHYIENSTKSICKEVMKIVKSADMHIGFLKKQKIYPSIDNDHDCTIFKKSKTQNSSNSSFNDSQSSSRDFFSFKCQLCDTLFSTAASLNFHLSTHKGKESFECRYCNKEFINRWKLNSHLARHKKIGTHKRAN
jgi:uncharacterized Zn-finger protein